MDMERQKYTDIEIQKDYRVVQRYTDTERWKERYRYVERQSNLEAYGYREREKKFIKIQKDTE